MITSLGIGVVLFTIFIIFGRDLAYIFTKDEDVSPLLAFSILMNSVQLVLFLSGITIGAGCQGVVVYVNLGCYYLIGIPFGILLGYAIKLQVEGVWIGMLIGMLIQTIILLIITKRTDWDKQVSVARKRLNQWLVDDQPHHRPQGSA